MTAKVEWCVLLYEDIPSPPSWWGTFFHQGWGRGLDESRLRQYIIKKIMCKDGASVCIRTHHRGG